MSNHPFDDDMFEHVSQVASRFGYTVEQEEIKANRYGLIDEAECRLVHREDDIPDVSLRKRPDEPWLIQKNFIYGKEGDRLSKVVAGFLLDEWQACQETINAQMEKQDNIDSYLEGKANE